MKLKIQFAAEARFTVPNRKTLPTRRLKLFANLLSFRSLARPNDRSPGNFRLTSGLFRHFLAGGQFFIGNEAGTQSEAYQSRNIMQVQPVHQLHAVVFDGLGTDL